MPLSRPPAALALLLVLTACSEEPEPPGERPSSITAPDAAAGGAAPILVPEELTAADIAAAPLSGELACTFAPSLGAETLFAGRADVGEGARAEGIVKLPGGVRELAMDGSGGFAAMGDGARFTGEGITVEIARTGAEPLAENPPIATESPAYPATMTLSGGTGRLTIEGVYECGP